MTDQEKLDAITESFIRELIKYKLEDLQLYMELEKRVSNLIRAEIAWRGKYQHDQDLMEFWGSSIN